MNEFIAALGLALAIEGCIYAAFPGAMKRMLDSLREQPVGTLRIGGIVTFASGVLIVWLARM
jgi:uncharacterized protein YjeT (DUF2065 family)